jgi:hypothetical protein
VTFIDLDDSESPLVKEREIQEAHKAVTGEIPLIEDPAPNLFDLPRGRHNGAKWETEVELRELTGADEEALARFNDPSDFFDGVVVYGTARVGSVQLTDLSFPERQSILAALLIGEREQLFINIARLTYGDKKDITHNCPACGNEAETTVILSEDIKMPVMENPYKLTHTMVTTKGDTLTYRLAIGSDQMAIIKRKNASAAEQSTLMISECVTHLNDKPVVDPVGMARSLSMGDRRRLLDHLVEDQPSPDMTLKMPCLNCGFELILPLSWGDIFRP